MEAVWSVLHLERNIRNFYNGSYWKIVFFFYCFRASIRSKLILFQLENVSRKQNVALYKTARIIICFINNIRFLKTFSSTTKSRLRRANAWLIKQQLSNFPEFADQRPGRTMREMSVALLVRSGGPPPPTPCPENDASSPSHFKHEGSVKKLRKFSSNLIYPNFMLVTSAINHPAIL